VQGPRTQWLVRRAGRSISPAVLPRYLSSQSQGDTADTLASKGVPAGKLPVAIFIDLDNVRPERHGREDIEGFVEPLSAFAKAVGKLVGFRAFGNASTRSFQGDEERERQAHMLDDAEYDIGESHTGYDEEGTLRCGICGSRMILNKKDRARGMTEREKLVKHMKLHDKEQKKRKSTLRDRKRKLSAKEMEKYRKYEAAQIDFRMPPQLFPVLRLEGVTCDLVDDVDKSIMKSARAWMKKLPPSVSPEVPRGCLVVVSQDSDFQLILKAAQEQGIVAVSAAPQSEWQTRKLCESADVVLHADALHLPDMQPPKALSVPVTESTRATALTEAGRELLSSRRRS